jgi:hypothetical protein
MLTFSFAVRITISARKVSPQESERKALLTGAESQLS